MEKDFLIFKKTKIFYKKKLKKNAINFKLYIYFDLFFSFFIIVFFVIFGKKIFSFINEKYKLIKINILLKNINKYILLCRKGNLIRGILKSYLNPKITILIPIYNSHKTIKTAIRSIQNQNFPDIEILLIDDASTDNSYEIIKELKNEDSRIKIMKNKINRGALFTKSIGAFNAKGKYIILLDSDDLFINENLFNQCYKEAENFKMDIIEFSGFQISSGIINIKKKLPDIPLYVKFKKNNEIVKQPNLSNFMFFKIDNQKYKVIDGYLCAKLIKTSVYINALKIMGSQIYNLKLNYGDDRIVNFILLKVANSFKFLLIYGFIYNYNPSSITKSNKKFNICHDELNNIIIIYNLTRKSNESEIVVYEVFRRLFWNIMPGLNKKNKIKFINLLNEILKCKYISILSKKKIKILLNYFKYKKFNLKKLLKFNN